MFTLQAYPAPASPTEREAQEAEHRRSTRHAIPHRLQPQPAYRRPAASRTGWLAAALPGLCPAARRPAQPGAAAGRRVSEFSLLCRRSRRIARRAPGDFARPAEPGQQPATGARVVLGATGRPDCRLCRTLAAATPDANRAVLRLGVGRAVCRPPSPALRTPVAVGDYRPGPARRTAVIGR